MEDRGKQCREDPFLPQGVSHVSGDVFLPQKDDVRAPSSIDLYEKHFIIQSRNFVVPNGTTYILQSLPLSKDNSLSSVGKLSAETTDRQTGLAGSSAVALLAESSVLRPECGAAEEDFTHLPAIDWRREVGGPETAPPSQLATHPDLLLIQAKTNNSPSGDNEKSENSRKQGTFTERKTEASVGEKKFTKGIDTNTQTLATMKIEPKEKSISCCYCSYQTTRKSHLKEHIRMIHLKMRTVCPLCGKEFANINQHMRVVHKVLRSGILNKQTCQECNKDYFDLTKHMAKAHSLKYVHNFQCEECNVKFKSRFIMHRHMQRKHSAKEECGECGKKVANLDLHIKKVHRNVDRNSSCTLCLRVFKKEVDVKRHFEYCKEKYERSKVDGPMVICPTVLSIEPETKAEARHLPVTVTTHLTDPVTAHLPVTVTTHLTDPVTAHLTDTVAAHLTDSIAAHLADSSPLPDLFTTESINATSALHFTTVNSGTNIRCPATIAPFIMSGPVQQQQQQQHQLQLTSILASLSSVSSSRLDVAGPNSGPGPDSSSARLVGFSEDLGLSFVVRGQAASTDHQLAANPLADHKLTDHQLDANPMADHQLVANPMADHQLDANHLADHQLAANPLADIHCPISGDPAVDDVGSGVSLLSPPASYDLKSDRVQLPPGTTTMITSGGVETSVPELHTPLVGGESLHPETGAITFSSSLITSSEEESFLLKQGTGPGSLEFLPATTASPTNSRVIVTTAPPSLELPLQVEIKSGYCLNFSQGDVRSQNFMECTGYDEEAIAETKMLFLRTGRRRKMLVCEYCPGSKMVRDMEKHRQKHHREKLPRVRTGRYYQCELCGYGTNRVTNYKFHVKNVHLKSRTVCHLCGKEYSNINQHMRVVHKTLKSGLTNRQTCAYCNQEYYDIVKHMRRAHKMVMNRPDTTCHTCGEKFTKYANMQRHVLRVHKGVKTTCTICLKQVSNIDKHKKVHRTGQAPGTRTGDSILYPLQDEILSFVTTESLPTLPSKGGDLDLTLIAPAGDLIAPAGDIMVTTQDPGLVQPVS